MPALTDEQAIAAARAPKPTPGTMKKVLAWVGDAPTPEKVVPLLLLETDNYASRKGLDALVQQALVACGRIDNTPLWECVDHDSDVYRVWHALRALATVAAPADLGRMLELGRTRLMRIHWQVIQDAAKAAALTVPADIATAQQQLESERGPADFIAHFKARQTKWPPNVE